MKSKSFVQKHCCVAFQASRVARWILISSEDKNKDILDLSLSFMSLVKGRAEDKEKLDLSFLSSHKENKDLDLYCKNKTKDVDDLSLSSLSSDKEKAETKGHSGFCCKDKTKDLDNLDLSSLSPDKKVSSFVLLVSR